jgi:hypothetical protein
MKRQKIQLLEYVRLSARVNLPTEKVPHWPAAAANIRHDWV